MLPPKRQQSEVAQRALLLKLLLLASIVVACAASVVTGMNGPSEERAIAEAGTADVPVADSGADSELRFCGAVGCSSGFGAVISDFDPARLPARRLTFCVNAHCYSIDFSSISGPPAPGTGVDIPARDANGVVVPNVSATYLSRRVTSTCAGDVLGIGYATDFAQARDGDRYTLTVDPGDGGPDAGDAGDGGTPIEFSVTATYTIHYPNGPLCGPACRNYRVGCTY